MTGRRHAAVALACALLLGGCTIPTAEDTVPDSPPGTTSESPVAQAPDLQAAVDAVLARHGGSVGLAVSDGRAAQAAGESVPTPAWSTIKVPLAIAALRVDPSLSPVAAQAIRVSDNAAADTLWAVAGADAVDAVLAEGQTGTTVNREVLRPEFSIFGQTAWSPADQARFAAHLPCVAGAEPVLEDMAHIDPSHSWGLGTLPGARFKGGWGPDPAGVYTARQFGLVPVGGITVAVALTVTPASGSFVEAQEMATDLAAALAGTPGLPAAAC